MRLLKRWRRTKSMCRLGSLCLVYMHCFSLFDIESEKDTGEPARNPIHSPTPPLLQEESFEWPKTGTPGTLWRPKTGGGCFDQVHSRNRIGQRPPRPATGRISYGPICFWLFDSQKLPDLPHHHPKMAGLLNVKQTKIPHATHARSRV